MKQTKLKLNFKGLIALIIWIGSLVMLLHDFAMLMIGYSFTWYGLATLGIVLFMGCEAENYLHELINRR